MADLQRVNGNLISWGSCTFKLGGEVFTSVAEIAYNDKIETAQGYGMAPHQGPRGRTRGKYSCDPTKVKMFLDGVRDLRVKLMLLASDQRSYGTVVFDGEVQFAEPGMDAHVHQLFGLRWTNEAETVSEGPDGIMAEIELNTMYIIRDGGTIFDSSQGFPSAG